MARVMWKRKVESPFRSNSIRLDDELGGLLQGGKSDDGLIATRRLGIKQMIMGSRMTKANDTSISSLSLPSPTRQREHGLGSRSGHGDQTASRSRITILEHRQEPSPPMIPYLSS